MSVSLLERSVSIEKKHALASIAETLSMLALYHHHLGSKALSDSNLRKAMTSLESVKAPIRRGYALNFIGDTFYSRQEIAPLLANYRSAHEHFLASGDRKGEARVLLNLAYAEMVVDDLSAAWESASRSFSLSKELDDARGAAIAQVALARVSFRSGRIREALNYASDALSAFPLDADRTERSYLLYALGELYDHLGDCQRSAIYFRDTLELLKLDNNASMSVGALWSLASAETACDKLPEAETSLDSAVVLARQLEKNDDLAVTLLRRGELEIAVGRNDDALKSLLEAAGLPGLTDYNRARIESAVGQLYLRLGRLVDAERHVRYSLALNQEIDHTIEIGENLHLLSQIALEKGDTVSAHRYITESVAIAERISLALDNRRLRSRFFSASDDRYKTLIAVLNELGGSQHQDYISKGFEASEDSRSRTLKASLLSNGLTSVDSHNFPKATEIRAQLSAKADALTELVARNADRSAIQAIEKEMVDLEYQLESVVSTNTSAAGFGQSNDDVLGFIRSALDAEDLLLTYSLGERQSFLWMTDRTGLSVHIIPGRTLIESKVQNVLDLVQARKRLEGESVEEYLGRLAAADEAYLDVAREISSIILGPVAEKIKGKRLIVVPDGKLNYFPISALPMPGSGSDDPILLTNEVIYQPSAQTYALLKKIAEERKGEVSEDLLVFSDPVFNSADERLTGVETGQAQPQEPYRFRLVESFSSLSRLPASKTEAETVSYAVGTSDLFMGFDATRERLLSTNLADYRVVHLATHGFVDPDRPELSSLIFSRFDRSGKSIDEAVRIHDIYSMKLNAFLVVLSACQTGTGKEVKGEGVMGLNTAFLQSGARSVVSTLWQVEDNAANELMKEFYGRMVKEGMSPSAALRAAQIKLYQDPQFRSPFFWAAFTIHGDAATAAPFKKDHTSVLVGIGFLAFLSITGFLFFRWRYRTSKV